MKIPTTTTIQNPVHRELNSLLISIKPLKKNVFLYKLLSEKHLIARHKKNIKTSLKLRSQ